jgi:hypothetical protein
MSSQQVISRLNDISRSTSKSSEELERDLATIPLRDMWSWAYSETMEVQNALGRAKKRIATARAAESRIAKVGAK